MINRDDDENYYPPTKTIIDDAFALYIFKMLYTLFLTQYIFEK